MRDANERINDVAEEIYVWIRNDGHTVSETLSCGVDGLITDKHAVAWSVLELRVTLSPAERILLELVGMFGVTPEIREL